jgi:Uma2 family endonuclease
MRARSRRATTTQKLTFDEYKNYSDGTNQPYELVADQLIPMSLRTGKHGAIAKFFERILDDEIGRPKHPWTA